MEYSARQIEIIEAATQLIDEGGVQNVTTKSLAKKMNFSEPAIYRHFKNKTEVLSSILDFFHQGLKLKINQVISENTTGIEKLGSIIAFQFEHFSKNPAIVMVIFSETSFQHERKLSEMVKKIMLNKKKVVAGIIEQGREDGSIRADVGVEQLASIFLGSMRFTLLQWRLNGYQGDLMREGAQLYATIHQLLTPPKLNTATEEV